VAQQLNGGPARAGLLRACLPTTILAAGLRDNSVVLVGLDGQLASDRAMLHGHARGVNCLAWLDKPDLASGSIGQRILLWDVGTTGNEASWASHLGSVNAWLVEPAGCWPPARRPDQASALGPTQAISELELRGRPGG